MQSFLVLSCVSPFYIEIRISARRHTEPNEQRATLSLGVCICVSGQLKRKVIMWLTLTNIN